MSSLNPNTCRGLWEAEKRCNDTQYNDIQHNGTLHNNKIYILSIMTQGTVCCCAECHFLLLCWASYFHVMLSVVMPSVLFVECRVFSCYAECRYAECRCSEYHVCWVSSNYYYAGVAMLNVVIFTIMCAECHVFYCYAGVWMSLGRMSFCWVPLC